MRPLDNEDYTIKIGDSSEKKYVFYDNANGDRRAKKLSKENKNQLVILNKIDNGRKIFLGRYLNGKRI